MSENEVAEKLRAVDINTLTPLEAINLIYELKKMLYNKVRELHVQKYPYNDFLYDTYDE